MYLFTRLPFVSKNSVSVIQRLMEDFIYRRKGAKFILEDVMISGETKREQDANLKKLVDAAVKKFDVKSRIMPFRIDIN